MECSALKRYELRHPPGEHNEKLLVSYFIGTKTRLWQRNESLQSGILERLGLNTSIAPQTAVGLYYLNHINMLVPDLFMDLGFHFADLVVIFLYRDLK